MRSIDRALDWTLKYVLPVSAIVLLAATTILVFIGLPYFLWACIADSRRPTFTLKKDDWSCSRMHEYVTTNMIMVGKIIVPQTITHHDCEQWSHK